MRRIETIAVVICLLFAIAISLYHVSYEGFLGLSNKVWGSVWAISENGLSLTMCFIVSLYSYGVLRIIFSWVFIPYFALKLFYHLICFSGIYLFPANIWEYIWSVILVLLIITALSLILTKKKYA